jgi:ABC-2 type transport system ATP-binding protein
MVAPALRFDAVRKAFGTQTVLDGVRLAVEPGEFFGLVGLNGAGKTTLIKGLLDFCAIDDGRIEVFGVGHRETASRSRLAFLPERFSPPHFVTGRDFLGHMVDLHGQPREPRRWREVAESLDLDPASLSRPVRAYSKGMAQKLGLAATLLSGKDLFVLDEPMSGLDPRARRLLKDRLRALAGRGRTVFFSTHLLPDVEDLCDRLAILHAGRVAFAGSPQECCRQFDAFSLEQAFLNCIGGAGLAEAPTTPARAAGSRGPF